MKQMGLRSLIGIGLLVSGLTTSALTINDSAYLGSWNGKEPASLANEARNIGILIDMIPTATPSSATQKKGDGKTTAYYRSLNFLDTSLPDPISSGGLEFEGNNIPKFVDATGFSYLTAKYGNFTAVWYLGELDDLNKLTVPWNVQHGLSNIKLLGPTSTNNVPDAGMTALLLGMGVSGVALIRRKF